MTEADFNPQHNGFTSSELAGDLLCEGDIKCITSIDANNNKLLIPALRGLAEDDVLLVGLGGNGVGERKSYRFTELLGLYRTRENATSGIVFGQLTMLGSGGIENSRLVAVKPTNSPWAAGAEYKTAEAINRAGAISEDAITDPMTFVPIGFQKLSTGDVAIISNFELAVKSFDNYFWTDKAPSDRVIEYALTRAAEGLIFLHANGFVHRDYQVKNTASDEKRPRIIDVTSVSRIKYSLSEVSEIIKDPVTYAGSLNARVSPGEPPYVTEDQIQDLFFAPYRSCVPDVFPRDMARAILFHLNNGKKGWGDYEALS